MPILGIFTDDEIRIIEAELKMLKDRKLHQDQARILDYEKQFQLSDNDTRIIATLHPMVKVMVRKTLIKAKLTGLQVGIDMGGRTWEKQGELYAKGRSLVNGVWQVINDQEVVTNALPGRSWHNYFCAVDIVMDASPKPGLQPSWQAFKDANQDGVNDWKQLGEIGESCGLIWGGRWEQPEAPTDTPHFQYHGDLSIEQAIALYRADGLDAVWEKIV